MKKVLFVFGLMLSRMAFAQDIPNEEFLTALNSFSESKMCMLKAYDTGVTILSCDGKAVQTDLKRDHYYGVNVTNIGSKLTQKNLRLKNCESISDLIKVTEYGIEKIKIVVIGNICYFAQ